MKVRRLSRAIAGGILCGACTMPALGQVELMAGMRRALPRTGGAATVAALDAVVTIERDDLGVPRIAAQREHDALRGLGFVHGQERFFQLDASRRLAAGRLAEVIGTAGLSFDRQRRPYRFDHVADAVIERMAPDMRRRLEVYAEGVNAGLADLAALPPEYQVIGQDPVPWAPRDSVLVMLTMFEMLNFDRYVERPRGVAHEALAPELVAFLDSMHGSFESPLLERAPAPPAPPIPGPDVIDLRARAAASSARDLIAEPPFVIGSNNWAVSGAHTEDGRAIVANDPHLQLTAPGIWYRAQLEYGDRRVLGLTLPGVPGVIIGSNGRLAWGVTNTTADFQDLIVIEVDPDDASRYRTPDGWESFGTLIETIDVADGAPVELALRTTRWGVVTDHDWHGRPLVLKWVALEPEMINLEFLRMAHADDLDAGAAIARRWYGPSQNVMLADATGRIGWVVSGYLPKRVGFDGTRPVSWAEPGVGWDGALDEADRPALLDPPSGLLYTANNRTVDQQWAAQLGRSWALGERAHRIHARLTEHDQPFREASMLSIQLDSRVEILDFYRDLVVRAAERAPDDDALARAAAVAAAWSGFAEIDDRGVRFLGIVRSRLHEAVLGPLVAPCAELDARFRYRGGLVEEPVRRLLTERPFHLLAPRDDSWDDLEARVIRRVVADLGDAIDAPWGESSRVRVAHPLTDAEPALSALLNMAPEPLAGHRHAVRVSSGAFGASARIVVSPGHEADGILQIPAGQSGHPMSPHYRSHHDDWLWGRPTRLLAGTARSRITLRPEP